MWQYEGITYLIAVNPTAETVEGGFIEKKLKASNVMFENRTIRVSDGILKDKFAAYERHVYKFTEKP
jgi:hypothetical protein